MHNKQMHNPLFDSRALEVYKKCAQPHPLALFADTWKMFVPLIVGYCFPKEEGLTHPWLLSTIATTIET